MGLCGECGEAEARYRCPRCRAPYCSAACCAAHRATCAAGAPAPPRAAAAAEPGAPPPQQSAARLPAILRTKEEQGEEGFRCVRAPARMHVGG